jgi:hypothetical protein
VVMGVASDQVPLPRDPSHSRRIGLGPAALDEERRPDPRAGKRVEQPIVVAEGRRPVRMLGVERERDPEGTYFSTPLMTMPRVKKRWKIRNRAIGITIVMMVPAWTRPGAVKWIPWNRDSPTASGWSSGLADR